MNDCWYADNRTIKYFLQWERSTWTPLCVCVSQDTKSFPALHLIPSYPTACTKQVLCLLPRGHWDTTASLNQTNLPHQSISATRFCSVATIHLPIRSTWLAGIVLQTEHSLAQQKVALGAEMGWEQQRLNSLCWWESE